MRTIRTILITVLAAIVILAASVGVLLKTRAHGFSARAEPTVAETLLARAARRLAMPADAKNRQNPVANSPEVLAEARAHWADHCALCHANNGSGDTQIGRNLYPPAPDMRLPATQQLTDGELFYIIENGVRLTGMPAWGGSEQGEQDSWKCVRFIRHLPQLTPEEEQEMERLNPKGPEEREEEQQEEEFLRGEPTHVTEKHTHH